MLRFIFLFLCNDIYTDGIKTEEGGIKAVGALARIKSVTSNYTSNIVFFTAIHLQLKKTQTDTSVSFKQFY